jgi:hypothetical protein
MLPELTEERRARIAIGGAVALVALAVALYGAPRFLGALDTMKMRQTVGALLAEQNVSPQRLQEVVTMVDTLPLAGVPAGQRAEAGYVALRAALAVRGKNPDVYQQRLRQADMALTAALRERPADSYSWARLAMVRLELRQPLEQVMQSWRLSVATAPFEPKLLLWRLSLGLAVYGQMSELDQLLVRQQTLNAWDASHWRTARLLAIYNRPDLLRGQLVSRPPAELVEFEKSYVWFVREREQQQQQRLQVPQN